MDDKTGHELFENAFHNHLQQIMDGKKSTQKICTVLTKSDSIQCDEILRQFPVAKQNVKTEIKIKQKVASEIQDAETTAQNNQKKHKKLILKNNFLYII